MTSPTPFWSGSPRSQLDSQAPPPQMCPFASTNDANANANAEKATTATTTKGEAPKLDFFDSRLAFQNKTTWEIMRALLVFRLCSIQWIVKSSEKLIHLSRSILGDAIPFWFIRHTFFRHFTAGDEKDLPHVLQRLQQIGIGAILDYAAEKDVSAPTGEIRPLRSTNKKMPS